MIVLVVSDIHANLVAFDAVLDDCRSYDAVWNIGDTVGYGPQPGECVDRMMGLPVAQSLAGNHDLACIGQIDLADFNRAARLAAEWTATQLGEERVSLLGALPSVTIAGSFTLAHGSPRSPVWEYVTDAETATANFACFDTDVCIVGHSHVALVAGIHSGERSARLSRWCPGETIDLAAGRFIVNPGSVGQPRDRDPRAAYAVLDTERGTMTAHRVGYDIRAVQRRMSEVGLPDVLSKRLAHGV